MRKREMGIDNHRDVTRDKTRWVPWRYWPGSWTVCDDDASWLPGSANSYHDADAPSFFSTTSDVPRAGDAHDRDLFLDGRERSSADDRCSVIFDDCACNDAPDSCHARAGVTSVSSHHWNTTENEDSLHFKRGLPSQTIRSFQLWAKLFRCIWKIQIQNHQGSWNLEFFLD